VEKVRGHKLDFTVFTANPVSLPSAIKLSHEAGFKTIIRKDKRFLHPSVKNDTVFAIQSTNHDFPFLSQAQENMRCAIERLKYLAEEKTRNR